MLPVTKKLQLSSTAAVCHGNVFSKTFFPSGLALKCTCLAKQSFTFKTMSQISPKTCVKNVQECLDESSLFYSLRSHVVNTLVSFVVIESFLKRLIKDKANGVHFVVSPASSGIIGNYSQRFLCFLFRFLHSMNYFVTLLTQSLEDRWK